MELMKALEIQRRSEVRGFTLVELLLVVAGAGLLLALAGMSLMRGGGGLRLQGTAEAVRGLFEAAKQEAVAQGRSREVRLYEWEEGGEDRVGFFLYEEEEGGEALFLGRQVVPEAPIRLERELTSLFELEGVEVLFGDPPGRGEVAERGRYVRLGMHPSGVTSLAEQESEVGKKREAFFSLTASRRRDNGEAPKDFVIFVIEAGSGVVTMHRAQ
jgi:hypothetical protein